MAMEQLRVEIDALAATDVVGVSQRDDLGEMWPEMARLDAQFARRIVEFDASVEWSVDGSRSAASWLIRNFRFASVEAYARVRIAREMAQMPIANAAWLEGRISSRHVDALTTVRHSADADAEFAAFEPYLVDVALEGQPEDVVRIGRQWRDALDNDRDRDGSNRKKKKDADHEGRRLHLSRSLNGIGILDGRFDTEGTEIIKTALRRYYERNHRADDPRSPAQQRADALVDICEHALDHEDRGTNRPHLMIAVDGATLAGEGVGRCETLSGYQLHPDTMRRLACDAIIQRIVLDSQGVPLDLGRATRTFTPDQYRVIMIRDGGCRMPGCDAGPEDCQAHHMQYWEHGGNTDLVNGIAVCRGAGHHRLIHEGGWTITGDPNGEITFRDPDGKPRGTSRPRKPPKPILTQAGKDITRAQKRAAELQHHALPRAA